MLPGFVGNDNFKHLYRICFFQIIVCYKLSWFGLNPISENINGFD